MNVYVLSQIRVSKEVLKIYPKSYYKVEVTSPFSYLLKNVIIPWYLTLFFFSVSHNIFFVKWTQIFVHRK